MNNEEMINIVEAAKILGVKPKTVYGWVERKKIRSYKIIGAVRFKLMELLDFRDSCCNLSEDERDLRS